MDPRDLKGCDYDGDGKTMPLLKRKEEVDSSFEDEIWASEGRLKWDSCSSCRA